MPELCEALRMGRLLYSSVAALPCCVVFIHNLLLLSTLS
jgi:hypothetical protein